MRGTTTKRKGRQPTLQEDTTGCSNGGKMSPAPVGEPPEAWRLEAAIVALLTLTDDDNRLICPPFRVLPTPAEFPLYYERIKSPIDLKCIAERVRVGHYADWAALEADIQLLCQNAKDFSEAGPMLRKDADFLLNHFKMRANEIAGTRRFSARVLTRNKEYIDELLRSTASEVGEYSEDSEEDEDSERSDDPLWRLYWTIRNFDVVDGVPLCENFMELPSKRSYPDYYEEIERPVSLYMVNKKLKRGQYNGLLTGLVHDLLLMFDNACSYNIEESDIYEAAQRLRKLTLQTVKKLDSTFNPTTATTQQQQQKVTIKQELMDERAHANNIHDAVVNADGGDGNDKVGEANRLQHEHQHHQQPQENHMKASSSPPPFVPKMNGTSAAMTPPVKRRKVAKKRDIAEDGGTNIAITINAAAEQQQPVRRSAKREASAKGEQAIKRMVECDFDDEYDVQQQRSIAAVHHHHQHNNNNNNNNFLQNDDGTAAVVPSTASPPPSTTVSMPIKSSESSLHKQQQQQRTPRRLNSDGTPAERLKPGRKSVDELREKFAQKLTAVWQDVHNLKMGNRSLAEPFLYLPCDKTFPDYYRTIEKPISLTCIQRKIKEQRYADSDELLADLRLMFANARVYNKPDAQICADVTILESVAVGSLRAHTAGVTLFYPYRRTDKGWSEKASIEKSPLKMKRKNVSTTPTTNSDTKSSPITTTAAAAVSSTATTTITTTTTATTPSTSSSSNSTIGTASSSSFVYIAPPPLACPTLLNAVASTSGAVYYAGPPPPPPTIAATFVVDTANCTTPQPQHGTVCQQAPAAAVAIIGTSVPPNGDIGDPMVDAAAVLCNGTTTTQADGAVGGGLLNGALYNNCATAVVRLPRSSSKQPNYCSSTPTLPSSIPSASTATAPQKAIVVNGVTVMIPANAQTVILPPGYLGAQQTQQIILHTGASSTVSVASLSQHQQAAPLNGVGQQQLQQMLPASFAKHHQQQQGGCFAPAPSAAAPLMNGLPTQSNAPMLQQMLAQPHHLHHHGAAVDATCFVPQQQHSALPSTSMPTSNTHHHAHATTVHQQSQQVTIDPGRAVVSAMPKMALPVFVEPSTSVKVQRVLHSEAYVRYIESMYSTNGQRTVSKWDKNMQANQRDTSTPSSSSSATVSTNTTNSVFFDAINNNINANNRRQLAQQWIRMSSNGSKRREEILMKALWTLRDQLIEGTLGIVRHVEMPADEPPSPSSLGAAATAVASSSSSGQIGLNNGGNNNNIHKTNISNTLVEKQQQRTDLLR